jgi:hypothetical protein
MHVGMRPVALPATRREDVKVLRGYFALRFWLLAFGTTHANTHAAAVTAAACADPRRRRVLRRR